MSPTRRRIRAAGSIPQRGKGKTNGLSDLSLMRWSRIMTARETFHEGALSLEQWRQVEALASSLTPSQARWISGYFAGLDAGLTRAGVSDEGGAGQGGAAAASTRSLTILYASETGNSRELANQLGGSLRERGLAPEIFDVASYKVRRLKEEQD